MKRSGFWLAIGMIILALLGCRNGSATAETPQGPMVLDYNFAEEPARLDPALAVTPQEINLIAHLFDGLTAFRADDGHVIPALAEAWDVSGNGLIYTFKMREDAFWVDQDGEVVDNVTAQDVAFGIRRACDPATPAPSKHILFIIKGCQEVNTAEGRPDPEGIGVRALDRFTVEFTLDGAAAYFPAILAMPVARPLPRAIVEAADDGEWTALPQLVTNGPYLIESWQRGEQLTLVKNARYYDSGAFPIQQVNGYFIDDPATALERYRAGELDTLHLPPEAFPLIKGDEALQSALTLVPEPCTYAYGFTTVKPPVDEVRVRRALSMAIDRHWLIDNVLSGSYVPARHFATPLTFGAPPPDMLGVASDTSMAQQLLAEAGYPEGQGVPTIRLMHPAGDLHRRVATTVAEMWRYTLNIEVQVEAYPRDAYTGMIKRTTPLEEMPHVWLLGWCSNYPDEHSWSFAVFNGHEKVAKGWTNDGPYAGRITVPAGGNNTRRTGGRLDELVQQAAGEWDQESRRELYAEAEQILTTEEALIAPIFHYGFGSLDQPWLDRNHFPQGGQRFAGWTIDLAQYQQAVGDDGEESR